MQTTRKIANIYSYRDAMREACRRWADGNDAGKGYPWEMPRAAAHVLDAAHVLGAANGTEVDVYALPDGSEVAVGDANGPWAVEITPAREATR